MEEFVYKMVVLVSGMTFSVLLLCLMAVVTRETIKSFNREEKGENNIPKTPKPPALKK